MVTLKDFIHRLRLLALNNKQYHTVTGKYFSVHFLEQLLSLWTKSYGVNIQIKNS